MSYAIIRNANYKKENLSGLYKHNERKNTNYSNKDINFNNSIKNYSIKKCNTTYLNAIKQLQQKYNLSGRIIKTTNIACELIITSDKEFFNSVGIEETKRYFKTAFEFVSNYNNLGEEFIISAKVHMDETTPHLHLVFVPVIHKKDKNGNFINKIACSEYWKGKDSYKQLQDNFYSYISKNGFNLERGKSNRETHFDTATLKQLTDYDNIKYETSNIEIKKLETQNIDLILAQNKDLILYTNKLKKQLSKLIFTIKIIDNLKKENFYLKQENQKLKIENSNLKNYILETFEVVKHLFNFPVTRLKRLVDNFIKTKSKTNE